MQKTRKATRIWSLLLVFCMVLTLLPAGVLMARAEGTGTNIKLHFENKWDWETPAVQYWGGSSTTVSGASGGPQEISGWGGAQGYVMTAEGSWYTLTLCGDFTGFQFLNMTANTDGSHACVPGYDYNMTQYKGETAQDLYLKWNASGDGLICYTNEACTTELSAPADAKIYTYTVHFSNPSSWSAVYAYTFGGSEGEAFGGWPGTTISANTLNSTWYDVELTSKTPSVTLIFNNGAGGDGNQTANLSIAASGDNTKVEAWVTGLAADDVTYTAPSDWKLPGNNVTIHYNNSTDWPVVNIKFGQGTSWSPVSGYEQYKNSEFGAAMTRNMEKNGWYDVRFSTASTDAINFLFNNGSWGSGNQVGNFSTGTLTGDTEVWIDGGALQTTAPESWTNARPVPAEPSASVKVNDLVQVKVGATLYTMEVYRNGVYEVSVPVSDDYTATLVVNGADTEVTCSGSAASKAVLRLKDGKLQAVEVLPAALVGNFTGLEFVDGEGTPYNINSWTPADPNAELTYLGGGLYGRTFLFNALGADLTLADGGYKVAFNDDWDYSFGDGGSNIGLTIPAGTSSLTLLVDEINKVVYDSVRSGSFEVAQNGGAIAKPALTTTVSLIGPVRGTSSSDWDASVRGWEFTQISDTLFRYQKTLTAGTYQYKCVFDYSNWYEAESGNRGFTLTEDAHVVFLYNTEDGKLYDSVNNAEQVAVLLGMQAAPAKMEVIQNPNGTTKFTAVAEDTASVKLVYGTDTAKMTTVTLTGAGNKAFPSDDIWFGDDAVDVYYYYIIDGAKTLDGSNPSVTVAGEEYSCYSKPAFTGRTVNVPGTFPGPSWDAASNQMTYKGNGRYEYTFTNVPAAKYEFKISFKTWTENYGVGGAPDGPNYGVAVPSTQNVTVYYSDFSHLAVTSVDYVFVDADLVGTGIPAGTKLTDEGLTGIYSATVPMAAGTYTDVKIVCGGQEYAFSSIEVSEAKDVTFYFDPVTGLYYHNASNTPVDQSGIRFDSKDLAYKTPFGAVATGENVTFSLTTGTDVEGATLVVKGPARKSVQMTKTDSGKWTATVSFDTIGEYSYYFAVTNGSAMALYGDDDGYYGEGKAYTDLTAVQPYGLIVYKAGYETPDWMKDAVIYQIYPDRFFNGDSSNDRAQTSSRGAVDYEFPENWYSLPENPEQEALLDEDVYKATGAYWGDREWSNEIYCGDLAGIIEKIDYLKALGVNVIYLNPVFSSISSHRYDACDYMEIDPILGDLGDFTELVEVAEANGMHIILDGVFNHVSDDSVYFDRYYKFLGQSEKIGAYPYWAYVYDYMAENGADQDTAEAAARAYFSANYGITDYSYTEWFDVYSTQLKDSDGIPAVDTIGQRAGKPVYGYDGWWGYDSMPIIKSTNGSEYQTGNWAEEIIYNEDGTSVTQYWLSQGSNGWRLDVANEVSDETWQKFRESVKALDSDAVIIGEIWDDASKYLMGDMYDSVMNYQFRNAVTSFAMGGSSEAATKTLEKIRERYPEEAFYAMMNLVGSHDTARILSYLDGIGDDRSDKSIEAAFPTYEATSQTAKDRQYLVAFTQFTYAGAPTIYYGDEIGMVGADDPDDRRAFEWGKGNQEILTWYATLAAIRAEYPALRTGSVEPFEVNENILAYVRRDSSNALIVLGSNARAEQTVTINPAALGVTATKLTDLISGTEYSVTPNGVEVDVAAFRGVILVASEDAKSVSVNQEALKPAYDPEYIVPEYSYYTVTAAAGEHGWIVPEGTCLVRKGESVTYTIVAARGYEVADVRVDGRSVGAVTSYTFENIQADHTITASFRVRALDLIIVSGIGSGPSITKPTEPMNFTDVSTADSFYNAVKYVYEEGLMNGTGDNKFSPYDTLNRAMVVTILYRIEGEPATRYNGMFTDVADYQWYTNAVEWAAKNDIVNGYGDGKFGPKDPVTREQLAAILYRYAQSKGYDVTASADLSGYADGANVSSYAVSAVKWAVAKNILEANQGKLQPRDAANRAQVAISMASFHQQYVK